MMAGNPNWWNMNIPSQPSPSSSSSPSPSPFLSQSPVPPLFQYPQSSIVFGSSPTSLPLASLVNYGNPELPQSWSQLLLGGFSGEEENESFPTRNLVGNWEDDTIFKYNSNSNSNHLPFSTHDLKQEAVPPNNNLNCQYGSSDRDDHQAYNCINKQLQNTNTNTNTNTWTTTAHNMVPPASSPTSCVTTLSSTTTNILDFSNSIIDNKVHPAGSRKNHQKLDHHSSNECNSTGTGRGGTCKKARVQTSSSTQSPLKVRKEKLGDRITALHQMVSPFGKTDTASVLLEAIGYIRFLQGQIEALSSPYIDNASGNLNNPANSENGEPGKDLRSRGLCLVPVSCTLQVEVGNDSSTDYWPPAPFSGGF